MTLNDSKELYEFRYSESRREWLQNVYLNTTEPARSYILSDVLLTDDGIVFTNSDGLSETFLFGGY